MASDRVDAGPKVPLVGFSGRESVFDRKLREYRISGQMSKPNRKSLEYIKNPTKEFQHPSVESLLNPVHDERGNSELDRKALIDEFSGLLNGRAFLNKLNREISRTARYNRSISLIVIELDVKSEMQLLNPLASNLVINDFSRTLLKNVRDVDIVGRFDEHTLVVICPETDFTGAKIKAARLRYLIGRSHFKAAGREVAFSAGIGLANFPEHGSTSAEVLEAALNAARQAVQLGDNAICVPEVVSGEKMQSFAPDTQSDVFIRNEKAEFEKKCQVYERELRGALAMSLSGVPVVN